MPRPLGKLTALQVNKFNKPGLYGDGGGLTLQITKAGVKSWLFRYMIDGKPYAMGLGPTHTVSLAEAREKALAARKLILDGLNPLEVKKQQKQTLLLERAKTMTFDACAKAYIEAHQASWRNAKHRDQWTSTIASYASPVFGSLAVAEIDTALVMKCLSPIWTTKTETASRLRGRIQSILDWATTSGYRQGENPARWSGHLENLLAKVPKAARTKNHPSLPWQKVGDFINGLSQRVGIAASALHFTILTACRSGEVRGAKWSEINLQDKVWTIPAARMKAGVEHQVPLSEGAMNILTAMERHRKNAGEDASKAEMDELVFPGRTNQPLSDMSLTAVIRRMNEEADKPLWVDAKGQPITVHGFRATFRMWCAEATNFPREVAEHALAHRLPDEVERAYQRGTQFAKRQALMQAWFEYCNMASKKQ